MTGTGKALAPRPSIRRRARNLTERLAPPHQSLMNCKTNTRMASAGMTTASH